MPSTENLLISAILPNSTKYPYKLDKDFTRKYGTFKSFEDGDYNSSNSTAWERQGVATSLVNFESLIHEYFPKLILFFAFTTIGAFFFFSLQNNIANLQHVLSHSY